MGQLAQAYASRIGLVLVALKLTDDPLTPACTTAIEARHPIKLDSYRTYVYSVRFKNLASTRHDDKSFALLPTLFDFVLSDSLLD